MAELTHLADAGLLVCPVGHGALEGHRGAWRCVDAACRCAGSDFPTVAGVPALVDVEHGVLDPSRLRVEDGASDVPRSRLHGVVRGVLHPANRVAPSRVARVVAPLRADQAAGRPAIGPGVIAGADTSLRWSIEHVVRALTRSVPSGLGRRTEHRATPAEVIGHYQGGR